MKKSTEQLKMFIHTFEYLADLNNDNSVSKDDLFIALLNTGKFSATEVMNTFTKAYDNGQIFERRNGFYSRA